jgi:hypothetical protein
MRADQRGDARQAPRDGYISGAAKRAAMNTDVLREINVRIYQLARDVAEDVALVCECGEESCRAELLNLRPHEFADVIATDGCRIVAAGHEGSGVELVRQRNGHVSVRATA